MKIFVSYARVDKPYCIRIIETLHAHDVWYDQRLYAGQDWWKEILRRLDWCDVFIYLLSPDSIASLYCRRELDIAHRLKRDIIPVLINQDTVLPDNMKDWQYVDLSDNLTVENVSQLLNAILIVERQRAAQTAPPIASAAPQSDPIVKDNPVQWVSNAIEALEQGDYDNAVLLLKRARASGYQSKFIRLDKLLRIAESALKERTQDREVEREYEHIVALFNFASTRQMACEALAEFRKEFGDYDPQNLRRFCDSSLPATGENPPNGSTNQRNAPPRADSILDADKQDVSQSPVRPPANPSANNPRPGHKQPPRFEAIGATPTNHIFDNNSTLSTKEILPMLKWCDIPHGTVTVSSIVGADEDFGERTEQVDNFVMSKYPVTNAQFAIFVQAEDGYRNPRWWEFSARAQRWFKSSKGPSKSHFSGGKHPRENVNWYEAMAFANWLAHQLKMKITLPTIAQWQRAAKGDDDRYFPWGDEYHEEHCNTIETGLRTTTPVDRYHKGVSPYGVFDMAGNIWEWTLNTADATEEGRDYRRAVAGGSFVSTCDRAQTSIRYYLDPKVRYSSIGIRLVGLT